MDNFKNDATVLFVIAVVVFSLYSTGFVKFPNATVNFKSGLHFIVSLIS